MNALIAVFIGGGLGSVARFGIGKWIATLSFVTLPLGTLVANVISSFILGIFLGTTALKPDQYQSLRFLVAAGFCGGFSTFSAFSAETFELLKNGYFLGGMLNIAANLIACLIMIGVGMWIGKSLNF